MKQLSVLSVFALGVAVSAAVLARTPGGGFERLDTDGDGLVSQMEFAERETRRGPRIFDHADADGDGAVSLDEMQAAIDERADERHAMASEHMRTLFEEMDGNEDGFVTREEAEAHAFARADANGDGFISEEEAREMHERRGGRQERRRERRAEDV